MHHLKHILFIAFALLSKPVFAQEVEVVKSDSVVKIDGDEYVIHLVQPKQTLFSIAKTYEVKLSRIAFDNPGVLEGLKLGQPLRILKSAEGETRESLSVSKPLELDGEFVLYTVPPKQTLYAISKEYNTTIEAILDANPELSEGLKVGATIRVPVPKMLGDRQHQRVQMEGLPDIMLNRVKEKLNDESVPKSASRIALLLPLYLDLNDTVMSQVLEGEPEVVYERSDIGLSFYEGFLLALDTLSDVGYQVEVSIFDTENRPSKVKKMIEEGKLNGFDLIVGPLYAKVFAEVAEFAYQRCVPIISPTIQSNTIFERNDYALKLIPSENALIESMGAYLSRSDSMQNFLVHYGAGSEMQLLRDFRSGVSRTGMKGANFKEVNLNSSGSDSLRNALSLTKRNNVVFLTSNEVRVASLVKRMSNWLEDAYVVGFAPSSWEKFNNIEVDYLEKLRLHSPKALFVDYEREDVQNFVLRFRDRYRSEPSTFAFRGYDLAMHLVRNLDGLKEFGPSYLESVQELGLQNDFKWQRMPDGGLENVASKMVDYTNYELKLATD